jgi:hypothetical protein
VHQGLSEAIFHDFEKANTKTAAEKWDSRICPNNEAINRSIFVESGSRPGFLKTKYSTVAIKM